MIPGAVFNPSRGGGDAGKPYMKNPVEGLRGGNSLKIFVAILIKTHKEKIGAGIPEKFGLFCPLRTKANGLL